MLSGTLQKRATTGTGNEKRATTGTKAKTKAKAKVTYHRNRK